MAILYRAGIPGAFDAARQSRPEDENDLFLKTANQA